MCWQASWTPLAPQGEQNWAPRHLAGYSRLAFYATSAVSLPWRAGVRRRLDRYAWPMANLTDKPEVAELPSGVVFIDDAEVAQRLGTKRSRIKQLLADNLLPALWYQGSWRIPEGALVELDSPLGRQVWAVRDARPTSQLESDAEIALPEPTYGVLAPLRGTITLFEDNGFDMIETLTWLVTPDEAMGGSPLDLIREGHHRRVNRIASTMG